MISSPSKNWPQNYQKLAEEMYTLRASENSSILNGACCVHPRHAVPAEHWELLRRIEANVPAEKLRYTPFAKKAFAALLSASYDSLMIGLLKILYERQFQKRLQNIDVLVFTWCSQPAKLNASQDFYFGNLADAWAVIGRNVLYVVGDGRSEGGGWGAKFSRFGNEREITRATLRDARTVPYLLFVPSLAPLRIALGQLRLAYKLRRRHPSENIQRLLYQHAALDCLRPYTTRNLYPSLAIAELTRRTTAKVFLTLYEGRPWEKLSWEAARKARASIRIVAYQHAVIMTHAFSVLHPQGTPSSMPDLLLCTGEVTRRMLEPGHPGIPVIDFGSLRASMQKENPKPPIPSRKTVLVVPEGILEEALPLFELAAAAASSLPDHVFALRCHPVLPFEQIRAFLSFDPTQFPNLRISTGDLREELLQASACLYRGSSTILQAVLMGLKPIYVTLHDRPDVDPLFEVKEWRDRVDGAPKLVQVLQDYAALPDVGGWDSWRNTVNYVAMYMHPVTSSDITTLDTKTFK